MKTVKLPLTTDFNEITLQSILELLCQAKLNNPNEQKQQAKKILELRRIKKIEIGDEVELPFNCVEAMVELVRNNTLTVINPAMAFLFEKFEELGYDLEFKDNVEPIASGRSGNGKTSKDSKLKDEVAKDGDKPK